MSSEGVRIFRGACKRTSPKLKLINWKEQCTKRVFFVYYSGEK